MGKLGERVGIVPALAMSTLVGVAGALILVAVVARGEMGGAFHQPLWLWSGGLLSLFIILAITVAPPRIGVAATVGLEVDDRPRAGVLARVDRAARLALEHPVVDPRHAGVGELPAEELRVEALRPVGVARRELDVDDLA